MRPLGSAMGFLRAALLLLLFSTLAAADARHEAHQLNVQVEKQRLLNLLGLKSEPKRTATVSPFSLARLQQAQEAAPVHHFPILLFVDPTIAGAEDCVDTMCLPLQMPNDIYRHEIRSASLWIAAHLPILSDATFFSGSEKLELREMRASDEGDFHWLRLNATQLLRSAVARRPSQPPSVTLNMECRGCSSGSWWDASESFLEVELRDPARAWVPAPPREKRQAEPQHDCAPDLYGQCCLQKQMIRFKDIGWDNWIVSPTEFSANYCSGNCRLSPMPRYHVEPRRLEGGSLLKTCCGPRKTVPLMVTYRIHGVMRSELIQDMSIVACECQ